MFFKLKGWLRQRRWDKYWRKQEELNHIKWADSLLTDEQKAKKQIAEVYGIPRHLIGDGPFVSSSMQYSAMADEFEERLQLAFDRKVKGLAGE